MKTLRSIIFYLLPIAFFCVVYAADNDHKIEYSDVQLKTANYFNQIPSEDWPRLAVTVQGVEIRARARVRARARKTVA